MKPSVKITQKKNEIKHYDVSSSSSTVYLNDGQTFEIMMFNPTQKVLLAMIELNGKLISQSGLIVKPGQRVFLERYLDSPEKFKFSTYTIENSTEAKQATAQNGTINVRFYEETEVLPKFQINLNEIIHTPWQDIGTPSFPPPYYPSTPPWPGNIYFCNSNSTDNISGQATSSFTSSHSGETLFNMKSDDSLRSVKASSAKLKTDGPTRLNKDILRSRLTNTEIETGRVEKGEHSAQGFVSESRNFNSWSTYTVSVNLKPASQKPVEASEIREYCTSCGTRRKKSSWEFCPQCGTKF